MDHSSSHEALSGYLGQGGGENWLALFKSPALPTEREREREAERKGLGERGDGGSAQRETETDRELGSISCHDA